MNTKTKSEKPKKGHGTLRLSQMVTTFGPGSMVDFPDYSFVMGGVDFWEKHAREINEPRLLVNARRSLLAAGVISDSAHVKFLEPPSAQSRVQRSGKFAIGYQFPNWFMVQGDKDKEGNRKTRRQIVEARALEGGKFTNESGKRLPVVPVRFVVGCEHGHLDEFPWRIFVHQGPKDCAGPIYLEDRGSSGDLSDLLVICNCGDSQPMSNARHPKALGKCSGRQPWLGPETRTGCALNARFLLRSASQAYFSHTLRAISIPEGDAKVADKVAEHYDDFFYDIEAVDTLELALKNKKSLIRDFQGISGEVVWQEIQAYRQRQSGQAPDLKLKEVEIRTLRNSRVGEDSGKPNGDFDARALNDEKMAELGLPQIEKVVLVHRLREVATLLGFTRFEPHVVDKEGEFDLNIKLAQLSHDGNILPARENRGEGIFISFKPEKIREWAASEGVKARMEILRQGFEQFTHDKKDKVGFPGAEFYLLHTLSHLLLTSVSLECGYSSSAIRERIYASDQGYGILLYTGTPDSEGTLGGLVDIGRNLKPHFAKAFKLGALCSNDPICSNHEPQQDERHLHGAACHSCQFIAETSCETFNLYLDRALVVPTLYCKDAAFFT